MTESENGSRIFKCGLTSTSVRISLQDPEGKMHHFETREKFVEVLNGLVTAGKLSPEELLDLIASCDRDVDAFVNKFTSRFGNHKSVNLED